MINMYKKLEKDNSKTIWEIADNVFVCRHNKFVISDAATRYARWGIIGDWQRTSLGRGGYATFGVSGDRSLYRTFIDPYVMKR